MNPQRQPRGIGATPSTPSRQKSTSTTATITNADRTFAVRFHPDPRRIETSTRRTRIVSIAAACARGSRRAREVAP